MAKKKKSQHNEKRRVIVVTDGDKRAREAVEIATHRIGGRCISQSAGNPTPIEGERLADLILSSHHDPVVVMVDDKGYVGSGKGERALRYLVEHPQIEIIGALAVASKTPDVSGVTVNESIDNQGHVVRGPVDKEGNVEAPGHRYLEGDTVESLNKLSIPFIVGIGDLGKMQGADRLELGAPITTKALQEILRQAEKME
ncbi:stage V sporulation protein AE [Heliorestis convoluta]|uniref:Stage V sporulation protein AE n=1 Tax=Heliorestis convoluta TaxID=356322 RepID=A0A5Q2N1L0_9FIRM|nr:stage V sporulation protein AE [Heliorestis convoluta]QGG49264.1 stage V sporulation protein AE [Heliorestis convoluta]